MNLIIDFKTLTSFVCLIIVCMIYIKINIAALITIIKESSIMVTVLIGKLNTAPKQAHRIFFLFNTLCKTPMMLMLITTSVAMFVTNGLNPVRNAIPKDSSMNGYMKPYVLFFFATMSYMEYDSANAFTSKSLKKENARKN